MRVGGVAVYLFTQTHTHTHTHAHADAHTTHSTCVSRSIKQLTLACAGVSLFQIFLTSRVGFYCITFRGSRAVEERSFASIQF